jgi:coatomer protein complex subunit alpha (xenin)
LAYVTAKTNGLHELAGEILESTGLTEDDVEDLPAFGASSLKPPPIVTSTTELNWPSISTGENFFDRALANGRLEGGPDVAYPNGVHDTGVAAESALDAWAKEEERDEIDPEEGGWELDAGEGVVANQDQLDEEAVAAEVDIGAGATPGLSETELWVRNSPFAADHIAAGSFETAMQACVVFYPDLIRNTDAHH